jgi:hypothetical protein
MRTLPAWSKHAAAAIVASVVLVGCVQLGVWVHLQFKIDSCLDRGGRWDYPRAACETEARQ